MFGRASQSSRRQYLKTIGGAITASGLAGCTGGDGGDETDASDGGDGGATTAGEGSVNINSIKFWDTFNAQSQSARDTIENVASEFSDETGVNVELNLSGFGEMIGGTWSSTFEEGEYPVIFTGDQIVVGQFEEAGYIVPFNDWKDQMSPDIQDGIQWILDGPIDEATRWMGEHPDMEEQVLTFPVGLAPQDPLQVRVDHLEEAGLDPESAFPPEDYDHLVEVSKTLTEDGPGDYGLQLHGHPFDWYTFIEPYTNALGGHKGEAGYFAPDYRSTNFDNDTYIQVVRDTIALFREHGVSGPQTPSIPDEDTVPLFLQGKVSMSPIEPMNYPTYHDQAPDLMESGDIRYGSVWDEPSGMDNAMLTFGVGITRAPDGVDQAVWERKQELAVQLAEKLFSADVQTSFFRDTGFLPARQDLWDQNKNALPYNDASRAFETLSSMALETSRGVHTSFPLYIPASGEMGPAMGKGYNGELTAEEIGQQAAEVGNEVVDDYWASR